MNRAAMLLVVVMLGVTVASLWAAASRSRDAQHERDERAKLERQITAFRDQMKQLERKTPDAAPAPAPVYDSSEVAPLRRETESLRAEVTRLQEENRTLKAANEVPPPARVRPDPAALQVRAKDGTLKAAERIEALMALRVHPGGRTADVVVSMLDLLESGIETPQRADILRHLKGAVTVAQAPRVITVLQADPERVVREEAAETLGPLKDDANVRAALEQAAQNDASDQVRREAKAALEGERRRRD